MSFDPEDDRWECGGVVQHCYTVEGQGAERALLLTASGSGEDALLFSTYAWPEGEVDPRPRGEAEEVGLGTLGEV